MCCLLNSDRLETKSFVSEISGRITKTIALPPAPSKRPKAYGTSSKVRLFPAPVGEDTNRFMQDRYSSIIFLWWVRLFPAPVGEDKQIYARQIFFNYFPLIGISGGLSSMFENHASLRMANFDWQLYPLGSTRTTLIGLAQRPVFGSLNWRQSSMKSPSFRAYLDEGLFESLLGTSSKDNSDSYSNTT